MKKLLFPALLVCLTILSSCGGETPTPAPTPTISNKKINKIYYEYEQHDYVSNDDGQTWDEYQSDFEEKTLRERWTWNDDKIISIENYSELYDDHSYNFTYNEDDHVDEIIDPIENEKMVCFYNGNQISKLEYYYEDELGKTDELVYSGNKIVQIAGTDMSYYAVITWHGDNVSMIKYFEADECVVEYSYSYDNKQNPYSGSNTLLALVLAKNNLEDFALMSKNNTTNKTTKYYLLPQEESYSYTYLYNNSYPTRKTYFEEHIYTESGCLWKNTHEQRYYYEYLDD